MSQQSSYHPYNNYNYNYYNNYYNSYSSTNHNFSSNPTTNPNGPLSSSMVGYAPPPPIITGGIIGGPPPPPPPPTLHCPNGEPDHPPPPPPPPPARPNEHHHCDACNTSFPNARSLQSHIQSHIQCTKCSFTASKKVVSAHYKASHGQYAGRGLKTVSIQVPGSRFVQRFKICVGDHPEDIQAWIAERKRRFPTRENVAKKLEQRKRRREEGAVLVGMGGGVGNKREKKSMEECEKDYNIEKEKVVESVKPSYLLVGNSIASLVGGYGSSSEDEEVEEKEVEEPRHGNNFDCLVDTTQSVPMSRHQSSNAHSNEPHGLPSGESESNPLCKYKTKQCRYFLRNGTCKNGDGCTYIHDMEQHEAYKKNADTQKEKQSQRDRARNVAKKEMKLLTIGRNPHSGRSGTGGDGTGGQSLLRKLLENDIRRERSLCLQLLRYIVDCNYLQEARQTK